jgi:NAD(P)-dependent dehydrogenase (short-subunit alcohol dehydrogenase family)
MLDFTGRTALFVGWAGALGPALADQLSARGARVFVGDGREALAEVGRLDILVIGGQVEPDRAPTASAPGPHLERATKALELGLGGMRAAGYGRVLNIAPAAGAFGSAADPAAAALAGGLIALAKSQATAHRDRGLCINSLSPLVAADALDGACLDAIPTLDPGAFTLEAPLALALYLCHETCRETGEHFSAGAGRFARIFQATAPGLFEPDLGDEEVAANLPAIMDPAGYIVPRDAPDELVLVAV